MSMSMWTRSVVVEGNEWSLNPKLEKKKSARADETEVQDTKTHLLIWKRNRELLRTWRQGQLMEFKSTSQNFQAPQYQSNFQLFHCYL